MDRTRKALYTLALATLVIACLIGVAVRSDQNSTPDIVAEFLGYEQIDEGTDILAVIRLTNISNRTYKYFASGEISSNGSYVVFCVFREPTPAGWREWNERTSSAMKYTFFLKPGASTTVAGRLSKTVQTSQIAVHISEKLSQWPQSLQRARGILWKWFPPKIRVARAWWDHDLCATQTTGPP